MKNIPLLTSFMALSSLSFYANSVEHDPHSMVRVRAAHVEAKPENGRAASVLIRGQVSSEWNSAFSSIVEVDHVSSTWKADHDDGLADNGKPFIPDVESTEINQLAVQLKLGVASFSLGRERIEFDDKRFIGSNNFWQNDQTFDAFNLGYEMFSASELRYVYVANVNRIFGDSADDKVVSSHPFYGEVQEDRPVSLRGNHEHKSHLLNLRVRDFDYQDLSFFYYDIENLDAPLGSNQTIGARYSIEKHYGQIKPSVTVSYALQERSGFAEKQKIPYYLLEPSVGISQYKFALRYESRGSKAGQGFVTPLASHHNFHGWADKFGGDLSEGIVDRSVHFLWRRSPIKIDARYHTFESYESGVDWGREFDLDIIYKFNRQNKLLFRVADYRSARESRENLPSEKRIFIDYTFEI